MKTQNRKIILMGEIKIDMYSFDHRKIIFKKVAVRSSQCLFSKTNLRFRLKSSVMDNNIKREGFGVKAPKAIYNNVSII